MIGLINTIQDLFTGKPAPHVVQTSLFFRDHEFGLSMLPFDLLVDESHTIEFEVTEHAVETGANIADHITEKLRVATVTGLFSNHSIKGRKSGYVDENGEIAEEPDEIVVDDVKATENSSYNRLKKLQELARRRNPVTLYTALEDFELENISMVIEHIDYERGPSDGESVKFVMKLREIRKAKILSRNIESAWNPPDPVKLDTPAQKKMDSKKKKGKSSAVEKTAQTLYRSGLNPKTFSPAGA